MAAGGAERFRDGGFQVAPTSYSDARRLVIQWQTYGMEPNINVKWEQLIQAIDVYFGSRVNNIMFHDGADGSTGNIKSPEDWGMEWSNEAMNVTELFQEWSSRQAVSRKSRRRCQRGCRGTCTTNASPINIIDAKTEAQAFEFDS
jgi:hypothetical protein